MWIIKQFNNPGPDYGKYQIGYFENLAGDSIFRGIGDISDDLADMVEEIHFLNGGERRHRHLNLREALEQISNDLVEIASELHQRL